MQSVRLHLSNIKSSRRKLFAIITLVITSIVTVPVILPHITDTSMIYHILLHVVSVIIAIFLGVVSILAYLKNGNSRLLFMMFAFVSLSIIEAIYLFNVSSNREDIVIPGVDIEVSHVIFLVTLTLFGIGIFRVSKQH
jgi:membrane-associated HD superfamily phosphohydrolase